MKLLKRDGLWIVINHKREIIEAFDTKGEAKAWMDKHSKPCLEALDQYRSWKSFADEGE